MSLVLDEFYNQVPHIGVSSTIGKGFDKILPKAEELKKEYYEVFLPELRGDGREQNSNNGEEGDIEEMKSPEAQALIRGQAMPTNPVGPDNEKLITR